MITFNIGALMSPENQMILTIALTVISILATTITTILIFSIRTFINGHQNDLNRIEATAADAHSRLDRHIEKNTDDHKDIRKEYVSEPACKRTREAATCQ